MTNKKQTKRWTYKRHLIIKKILLPFLMPFLKKYGYKCKCFDGDIKRNYLILYNHVTNFDQFMLAYAFKKQAIYYVTTEDLFSNPIVSFILRNLVNPIPFKKSTNDTRAVMNCIKVSKEGGNIAISPEGNRTYSGKTEAIKPSIAKFAKALKLPIAFFILEGGYGVQPRWSDDVRKGKCYGNVKKILEYDEYKDMSNDELYQLIIDNLYQDDTLIEGTYKSKRSAEYIERVLYVCPNCGLSSFTSRKDIFKCNNCNLELNYNEKARFESKTSNVPFNTIKDWYEYQSNYIRHLDLNSFNDKIIYTDKVRFYEVILYKRKKLISKNSVLEMYNNKYVIKYKKKSKEYKNTLYFEEMLFDNISATSVLGKNKINIYYGNKVYQIKASKSFNGVKYVNIYYHYKNIKEKNNEQFLGL